MPRIDLIQVRRAAAADWATVNPVLASGELGGETDTGRIKVGDGGTAWNALAYPSDASHTAAADPHPVYLTATEGDAAYDASGAAGAAQSAAVAVSVQRVSNLSDLASASDARTNLGLGTAATQASTAFDPSGSAAAARSAAELASLPRAGGALTGPLTLPGDPTADLHAATRAYVLGRIAALVASSPAVLDTLDELAAALGDDPNFATTMTAALAGKETPDSAQAKVDAAVNNLQLGSEALTDGGEFVPRRDRLANYVSIPAGAVALSYFTAKRSETVTSLTVYTANIAAGAAPTICRLGLYEIAADGTLTLVASTPNDTTLFAATFTAYTRALSVPFAKVAGQRYATALLVVTAAAVPTFHGLGLTGTYVSRGILQLSPQAFGEKAGQTDLPASITAPITGYTTSFGMRLS